MSLGKESQDYSLRQRKSFSFGDVYVVTNGPNNVDKLDNGFRLHGGGGVYLATTEADIGSDPFMYWQTDLADNVWSYDVDVSNVGCKCNAAMYWVNMPGENGPAASCYHEMMQ